MEKKTSKTKDAVTLNSLDKKVDYLGKKIEDLTVTVESLATATAKGFANTATKQELKDLESRMENKFEKLGTEVNNSIEGFVKDFRGDYDVLTSRVKRLETAVFKR